MESWAQITGIPAPRIWLPGWVIPPMQALVGLIELTGANLPVSTEGLAATNDYTYWASANKAKPDLGWSPRPVEETFGDVLSYELKKLKGEQ